MARIIVLFFQQQERGKVMGYSTWPVYGNADLGSAIETVEAVIAKIKTNKFDNDDIVELHTAVVELEKSINEAKN